MSDDPKGKAKQAGLASTVEMAPQPAPRSSADVGYQETVAMSPDGNVPDEVKAARAEVARLEAAMKSSRREPPAQAPKKSPVLLILLLVLLLAAGVVTIYMMRFK